MDNHIIRVYRFQKNNPQKFVWTVEKVGLKRKLSFTNYEELWEILNAPGYEADYEKGGLNRETGSLRMTE